MQNGLRHCLNNVPQRMRSGAKAVIIELQMVILLQQKHIILGGEQRILMFYKLK